MRKFYGLSSLLACSLLFSSDLAAFGLDALAQDQGTVSPAATPAGQGRQVPIYMGQPITYWIELFRSRDAQSREMGYKALGSVGENGVPYLVELLKDPDEDLRMQTVSCLRGGAALFGSDVALQALLGALKDESRLVRDRTLTVLSTLGWGWDPRLESAKPLLIEALNDKEPGIRRQSVRILGKMGPENLPHLVHALEDPDSLVVVIAAEAIADLGPVAAEATPALLKALESVEQRQRGTIIRALGSIGAGAREAIPVLLKALDNFEDASQAVYALCRIGPDDPRVLEAFVETMKTPQARGRRSMADIDIAKLGPAAAPYVMKLLQDGSPGTITAAARVLVKIMPQAGEIVPPVLEAVRRVKKPREVSLARDIGAALGELGSPAVHLFVETLNDPDPDIRAVAAGGLKRMGKDAREALPALIAALKDNNSYVVYWSVEALGNIGGEANAAVPELIRLLQPVQDYPRRAAAEALGKMGAEAREAIPSLLEALKDKDDYVQFNAARALVKIGADPGPSIPVLAQHMGRNDEAGEILAGLGAVAVPRLVQALGEPKDGMGIAAFRVLQKMGPAAREAVPALTAMVEKGDLTAKSFSMETLGAIGPDARGAVPAISQVIKGGDESYIKVRAVDALGRIGPGAAEAIPVLADLLRDKTYRLKAVEALGTIGPKAVEAVPKLIDLLKTGRLDENAALTIGETLGALGKNPGFTIEKLKEGIDSDQGFFKLGSAVALCLIDPRDEAASNVLVEACVKVPEWIPALSPLAPRLAALGLGAPVDRAVERLIGEWREKRRWTTIVWLGEFGPRAKGAMPALIEAWKEGDPITREQCLLTWGKIGPDASEAIPLIKVSLKDWRVNIRNAAFTALGKIDPGETALMFPPR